MRKHQVLVKQQDKQRDRVFLRGEEYIQIFLTIDSKVRGDITVEKFRRREKMGQEAEQNVFVTEEHGISKQ